MTPPGTPSRVLLVADRSPAAKQRSGDRIRRYRLARLRFAPPPVGSELRFEHLKRVYD
jgi:hypothetical protein